MFNIPKYKNKIFFLFLFFILFSFYSANAQEITISKQDNLKIIENKVTNLENINNKVLNTVYWTLGTFVAALLGIIALNFFQNFTLNKRRLEDIKDETKNSFEKELDKFKDKFKKLEINFDESSEQIKEKSDAEIKRIDISTKTQIESRVKTEFSNLVEKQKNLQEDFEDLERDMELMKSEKHAQKGQLGHILCILRALEIDIKKNNNYAIHETLDLVHNYVKKHALNSDIYSDINFTLSKLSKEYKEQKKEIKNKMRL